MKAIAIAKLIIELHFIILATKGTKNFLDKHFIKSILTYKVHEGNPNIVDKMEAGEVNLVFNTTQGVNAISDSRMIRSTALDLKIPYYTTLAGISAATGAMKQSLHENMSPAHPKYQRYLMTQDFVDGYY